MILHPTVLALLISSVLIFSMTLYASYQGAIILHRWNISNGSELQLVLERRTYLISTILCYLMGFQLVSLFLFVRTADSICHLFVGAMCAVGSLSANSFGYPTLLLKMITFVLSGLWLILNYVDNQGFDYPLIRPKYVLLLILAPLLLAETVTQALYFLKLQPDIITSCCGTLFSQTSRGIASELSATKSDRTEIAFWVSTIITMVTGLRFYLNRKGGYLFAGMSGISFLVYLAAIISFISLYIYEMPSHHCPFCILQKEYRYIGYLMYLLLFNGVVTGMGVGVLNPFRRIESIKHVIPEFQKKLTVYSVSSSLIFIIIVIIQISVSDFNMR